LTSAGETALAELVLLVCAVLVPVLLPVSVDVLLPSKVLMFMVQGLCSPRLCAWRMKPAG